MTKILRKAIANRSRLENIFYRYKTDESKRAYKKQKNYCSMLYKKARKNFYINLDIQSVTDSNRFLSTVKPFFSDKGMGRKKITLIDDNRIISEDVEVAKVLNTFFDNAVTSLNIHIPDEYISNANDISDPIESIKNIYCNHPSIVSIIKNVRRAEFSFCEVQLSDIEAEIKSLNARKASNLIVYPSSYLRKMLQFALSQL